MKPAEFPEINTNVAEHQEEYLTLPAFFANGVTISCWRLSWRERLSVLFKGKLWLMQMNGDQLLQPQRPQVENPFEKS
jgi:hypothetical protein